MVNEQQSAKIIETANNTQPTIIHQFKSAIAKSQLGHAFLFIGPNGRGQTEVAEWLAMRLLCLHPQADGEPDGTCHQCLRIAEHEHPDVIELAPDGARLKVEQVRYLQEELTKTAVEGAQKVMIIQAAETMTTSAANSLLKSIEEPLGQQTIILLATSRQRILPTIVSRTQVIEFPAIGTQSRLAQMEQLGYSTPNAHIVMQLTDDVDLAKTWLSDDWFDRTRAAVEQMITGLIAQDLQVFALVQTDFMPLAREQSSAAVVDVLVQATRDILIRVQGSTSASGFVAIDDWQRAVAKMPSGRWIEVVELALEMPKALDMNMNAQTTLESFVLQSQKVIAG